MNKKLIPMIVQLKQNNAYIVQGINYGDMGVIFDIKVMDGLVPFDFTGYAVVTLKIQKPDGTFTYDSTGGARLDIVNSKEGRLKIALPTSCTAQEGMHFCYVGFGYSEQSLFETMRFNYFVGEDPNVDDDAVRGTNEFFVLTNLIAQASAMISAENIREYWEMERQENEEDRKSLFSYLFALFIEALGYLEDTIGDARSLLIDVMAALAEGGSVDISQLEALATKTYVTNSLKTLDFGVTGEEKTKTLQIYRGFEDDMEDLEEGELAYVTDTGRLLVGGENGVKNEINGAPYIRQNVAPADTTKFWIDTSGTAPLIKFHDGNGWVACNTAVFA